MQICVYATGTFFGWLIVSIIKKKMCKHKWKHIETVGKGNDYGDRSLIFVMQCEHCGKIKGTEIK